MKHRFLIKRHFFVITLAILFTGCSYDDGPLWKKVNEMDSRLTNLEQIVSRLNTDINSFQALLQSLQKNVYVTDLVETPNGYILTLSDNRQITIRHGDNGQTPHIGNNGNWWIGDSDTGIKAKGEDGKTPHIGENGNWWIGFTDLGVKAKGEDGHDGQTPRIGENGNWWIGDIDTGVKAKGENGTDGLTPYVGDNGNWWIGTSDTGFQAIGRDGLTPYIGSNDNWWIGTTDTGVNARGDDGETPHIGENGNWWIGSRDTGIQVVSGDVNIVDVPIIGIDIYDGIYYWTVTTNGETTWLVSKDNKMLPVSGFAPIFQVDYQGYLIYTVDNGVTWLYVYDNDGYPVSLSSGNNCTCTQFFQNVYISGDYLILILTDGTEIKILIKGEGTPRGDIPDDPTEPTPTLPGTPNTSIPYPHFSPQVDEWGNHIVTMDFTGIQDPNTGEWIDLFGTNMNNQNVWVEVDGSPKGIVVINLKDNTTRMKNDIVFTVDNSGSMSEEANAVARDIIDWSQLLANKGLDVKFGVVGYDVYGKISGALNLTDVQALNTYLSRSTGTNRTVGFAGNDASTLQSRVSSYNVCSDECGALAIRYADQEFNFRATANRTYVNFTDEPNQPNGKAAYSVEFFKDQSNWPASSGTVHSVFSGSKDFAVSNYYKEQPWLISDYTGGTKIFVSSTASDLHLETLPVSDALIHSYTIRFIIPENLLDGLPHTVRIVVIANNGTVRGVLEVTAIFGTL